MSELDEVLLALSAIRAPRTTSEYDLHALITDALREKNIAFRHEVPIAPRKRIDFVCGTVGIEVKRGKPAPSVLIRQLDAYAASDALLSLVIVAEKAPRLPERLRGKPLAAVSLSRLWGIAL